MSSPSADSPPVNARPDDDGPLITGPPPHHVAAPHTQARLNVIEQVIFQQPGAAPVVAETRHGRSAAPEQPYYRQLTVGEQWQPLDTGWVQRPGLLAIHNDSGSNLQRVPTEAERAELEAQIVEIGVGTPESAFPLWLIRPGDSFRGEPARPGLLWLRCRKGTAPITLYAFPG